MKEDVIFIQKMKEVLKQKAYEKTLSIIEYLETNSVIMTQTARQITGDDLKKWSIVYDLFG